jgi:hypothetical protein
MPEAATVRTTGYWPFSAGTGALDWTSGRNSLVMMKHKEAGCIQNDCFMSSDQMKRISRTLSSTSYNARYGTPSTMEMATLLFYRVGECDGPSGDDRSIWRCILVEILSGRLQEGEIPASDNIEDRNDSTLQIFVLL